MILLVILLKFLPCVCARVCVHACVSPLRGTHVAVRGQPAGLPSIMRGLRIKLGLPELAASILNHWIILLACDQYF